MSIRLAVFVALSALGLGGCMSSTVPVFWQQGTPTVTRHTLKELRDLHVIKQQEDFSCGAAALATLMRYYFGDETSEQEILRLLESALTEEQQQQKALRGFSLLDLKQVARQKGYRAAGFRLRMSQLARVQAPVIVLVEPMGYKHFAVYRGLDRGRVYLADPARGNLRMTLGRFLSEWSGIIFVLGKGPDENIMEHDLRLPYPPYVHPEWTRLNAILDLRMLTGTLPQR